MQVAPNCDIACAARHLSLRLWTSPSHETHLCPLSLPAAGHPAQVGGPLLRDHGCPGQPGLLLLAPVMTKRPRQEVRG